MKFDTNQVAFDVLDDLQFFVTVFHHPELLVLGLPFSLTLLTILMAHELGHYLTCVYYRIDASPPYFLPAPSLTRVV